MPFQTQVQEEKDEFESAGESTEPSVGQNQGSESANLTEQSQLGQLDK